MDQQQAANPLDRFWGWLMFFYVGCWVGLVVNVGLGLFILVGLPMIGVPLAAAEAGLYVLDMAVTVFLLAWIIRIIRKKEAQTPNRVLRLLSWVLLLVFLFFIPEYYLFSIRQRGDVESQRQLAALIKGLVQTLAWYAIWSSYFKKSKRVLAYYGRNADEPF